MVEPQYDILDMRPAPQPCDYRTQVTGLPCHIRAVWAVAPDSTPGEYHDYCDVHLIYGVSALLARDERATLWRL